jgi:hypothetical protein
MGVQIFTNDANDEALQISRSVSISSISVKHSHVPYTPNVKGIMNGDFHLIQMNLNWVSSSVKVDDMVYETVPWETSAPS